MKKTIGFSNKNNMWTSKYDYVSSNYSTIDKKFFSSNKQAGGSSSIAWQHNEGPTNSFYNTAYPSTVAVSFAGNPSENKLYKSMSLEGNGQFKNTVNAFTTSDFITAGSGRRQYINAGLVNNYGGNHYAHLGNDPRVRPTADLKYLGTIQLRRSQSGLEPFVVGRNMYKLPIASTAVGVGQSANNRTKLLFSRSDVPAVSFIRGTQLYQLQDGMIYSDVNTDIYISDQDQLRDARLSTSFQPDGLVISIESNGSASILDSMIRQFANPDRGGLHVFALIDPKHSGDMMRGQFAEAHFTFPPAPFELYSLNLNYEPTDLDHSK